MKRLFKLSLFLTLLILGFISNAQNLTIDQVISLRTKSLVYVEEYLAARNWELLSAKDQTRTNFGEIIYSYHRKGLDYKANAFLTFLSHTDYPNSGRVMFQFSNLSKNSLFINRLKMLGFKLADSGIKDGSITKIYKNKTLAIVSTTSIIEDEVSSSSINSYKFYLFDLIDFEINYQEKFL